MIQFFAAASSSCAANSTNGFIDASGLPKTCATPDTLSTIFLIVFSIIGALAFLFLVLGGARYTMSQGNPESIQKAKNQIQYSLIGLIIAVSAGAIVNYVIGRF
jgi:hypothetical protein